MCGGDVRSSIRCGRHGELHAAPVAITISGAEDFSLSHWEVGRAPRNPCPLSVSAPPLAVGLPVGPGPLENSLHTTGTSLVLTALV